jgi:hypothetical protein
MVAPIQKAMNKLSQVSVYVAGHACIGYVAARVFTKVNPLQGAALCAISSVVSALMKPLFDKLFAGYGSNHACRQVGAWLNMGISIVATAAIASVSGCPITMASAAMLACYAVAVHVLLAAPLVHAAAEPIINLTWV